MNRRNFVQAAGVGAVGSTLAAPAIAQALPDLKWRLTSSFPKSLDTLFGGAEAFARRVAQLTNNKFEIRVHAPGEVVPALQALDAVQNGTVEMAQTAGYYFVGKDPTLAFDAAVPFGLTVRQQTAWMRHGGGLALMREVYKDYNAINFPGGNTGAQMGGWFRKEIKSVEDLKGLKFRIAGIAGDLWAKLGVVPQQIAGGEIYPALERGTVDAAEWVGPYDDEKLGFAKVAPFYYYPGFWEGSTQLSFLVGLPKWEALPAEYKNAIEVAAAEAALDVTARYDHLNAPALKRLVAGGAQLRPFPAPVMEACFNAANELFAEISGKNAKFKKVFDSWKQYRTDQALWFRVTENTFDNFMGRMSAQNKL
jgi:TRAP-type mannitol/chloroaromatic compound transport system substrate-binding protein